MSRTRLYGDIYPAPTAPPMADHGCYPDELPCLLAARADAHRRIIVTGATAGMLDFIENLLYSLHAHHANNYIVFALDAQVATALMAHNVPVYWDPAPLASLSAEGGAATLSGGLSVVTANTKGTGSAFTFGSSEYQAVTMRKNEIIAEVLALGYHAFFTDADTVWLRNPLDDSAYGAEPPRAAGAAAIPASPTYNSYLGHRCSELRLGDTVTRLGETPPAVAQRSDCAGGVGGQYEYDVKGMYGDVGGMDTGYWYIRSTPRSRAHMARVMAFQRTPAGLAMPSDQETFNELLKPWLPAHLAAGQAIDSLAGFGPSAMRVAMFDPLEAPNGCRLKTALAARTPLLLVHANCRTGWWEKVPWLIVHNMWFVRLWTDTQVTNLAALVATALAVRFMAQFWLLRKAGAAAAPQLPAFPPV